MEEILEKIKDFADRAHGNQKRKYSNERYIVHPVRVMKMCREYTDDVPTLAAALLHDVLEDTQVSRDEIRSFLTGLMGSNQTERTLKLVDELTDVYVKKDYPKWNRRKRKSKEAERIKLTSAESQTIKYADTIDNCKEITDKDPEFADVFVRECKNLLLKIPKGNPELYRNALETVNECLSKLNLHTKAE